MDVLKTNEIEKEDKEEDVEFLVSEIDAYLSKGK